MTNKRLIVGLVVMGITLAGALVIRSALDPSRRVGNNRTGAITTNPIQIMGTRCSLTAVPAKGQRRQAQRAITSAERALRLVEAHMSTYLRFSELSQLNRAPIGEAIKLSEDTMDVLRLSRLLETQTGGAFDVTCLPLFMLWAQAGKAGRLPGEAALAAARAKCGWDKWKLLEDSAVKSVEGAGFGLGGVAKGWAIDRATETIAAAGCTGALVEVGGDIRCFGRPGHKDKWIVAVQNPFDQEGNNFFGTLAINDAAVCTSGNYERFTVIDGKRYSHIIDPRTGKCVDFAPSVTVVAPTAAMADAWATALSVLGSEGFKLLDANSGIEAMLVVGGPTDYRIQETPGFSKLLDKPIPRSQTKEKSQATINFGRDAGAKRTSND